VSLDGAFARADPAASPEEASYRSEQRRIVQEALEDLTFTGREVVVLVDLEERAATEVAQMLGVPVGTVYSRLHHARRAFAAALARRGVSAELVVGGAA